jgi:sulfatase modifying factor 1
MQLPATPAFPSVVPVPAGSFLMGSPLGRPDEAPVHQARVAGFSIAATPVTNRQYAAFLAATRHPAPLGWSAPGFSDPAQPVVGVSWFDASRYCRWLSAETGVRWRLPSEAEWERAARGGLEQAPTAWGERLPPGEIPEGPLAGPWPVGRGTANGFGLLDVGTVVHEWCRDWYAPYSEDEPAAPRRERRASRGGSWRHLVRWSPPAARSSLPPSFRYADYGFRPLREAA